MKRWIRRIFFCCSIALMVAAVGLWIRSALASDTVVVPKVAVFNIKHVVEIRYLYVWHASYPSEPFWSVGPARPFQTLLDAWPELSIEPTGIRVVFPYWLLLAIGSVHPTFVWMRHRRQKKAVGFPIEATTSVTNEHQS